MAANRSMQSFHELRVLLEHQRDDAVAALDFMERMGLGQAGHARRGKKAAGAPSLETVTARATEMFVESRGGKPGGKKRASANGNNGHEAESPLEPSDTTFTVKEAAKALKCSDANVRLMINDGRLPKAKYEKRASKKRGGALLNVMVIPKDAVLAYKEQAKADATAH